MRDEFSEDTKPVETTWELTDAEQRELADIFPRAKNVRDIAIGRYYHSRNRWVNFERLPNLAVDTDVVNDNLAGLRRSVTASLRGKDAEDSSTIKEALDALAKTLGNTNRPRRWADDADDAIEAFRSGIGSVDPNISDLRSSAILALRLTAER
jgi:hypothetical protein